MKRLYSSRISSQKGKLKNPYSYDIFLGLSSLSVPNNNNSGVFQALPTISISSLGANPQTSLGTSAMSIDAGISIGTVGASTGAEARIETGTMQESPSKAHPPSSQIQIQTQIQTKPQISNSYTFENLQEKKFLFELFPELKTRSLLRFAVQSNPDETNQGILFSPKERSQNRLIWIQEKLSIIYSLLENNQVKSAGVTLTKLWKSTENTDMLILQRFISIPLLNKFIEKCLELELQAHTLSIPSSQSQRNRTSSTSSQFARKPFSYTDHKHANIGFYHVQALDHFHSLATFQLSCNLKTLALFISFYLETRNFTKLEEFLRLIESHKSNHKDEECGPIKEKSGNGYIIENFNHSITNKMDSRYDLPIDLKNLFKDDTFYGNEEKCQQLNEYLVSTGREPINNAPMIISDLLKSVLDETSTGGQKGVVKDDWLQEGDIDELDGTSTDGVRILRKILKEKDSVSNMDPYNQQLWLESRALVAAQEQYQCIQGKMPESVKKSGQLPKDLFTTWHSSLSEAIKIRLAENLQKEDAIQNFLRLVDADTVSRIVITSILRIPQQHQNRDTSDNLNYRFGQIGLTELCNNIGTLLQREHTLHFLSKKENQRKFHLQKEIQQIHASGKLFNLAVRKVVAKLQKQENNANKDWFPQWGPLVIAKIGSFLLEMAIKVLVIPVKVPTDIQNEFQEEIAPALEHTFEWRKGKKFGIIRIHPDLYHMFSNGSLYLSPWNLPMLVRPLPWLHSRAGGYLQHRLFAIRTAFNKEHEAYIKAADESDHLTTLLRSLDVLGKTGWNINRPIFQVASKMWNTKDSFPGLPTRFDPPPIPIPENIENDRKVSAEYRRAVQARERDISNSFSERCSTNYKLDIANAFLDDVFYFPHSVDFRGRAYPIPPNLNHIGDDLCRGLLKFSDQKPLGERGLYWLKVHISNLYGHDKVSLDDRYAFTEANLENILDSAKRPIEGNRWWLNSDKPWQLLASCIELAKALQLDDPTSFMSQLPVHQDGSCNGLQHYAALGGDQEGAEAVNLAPSDRPDDVYTRVAQRVQVEVDKDFEENMPEAILMKNRINRKLVKQTVMTNTYGVTMIGARDQVYNRLKEAREKEDAETQLTDVEAGKCASYVTKKIFESMDKMFEGARKIQFWLTSTARLVTQSVPEEMIDPLQIQFYNELVAEGLIKPEEFATPESSDFDAPPEVDHDFGQELLQAAAQDRHGDFDLNQELDEEEEEEDPFVDQVETEKSKEKRPSLTTSMIWTSPLGFPIVQPYRKDETIKLTTPLQNMSITDSFYSGPINSSKQASAFPPNYIHSLDACHMMLTAISCESQNITFASVHDSYWTHACDIDEMSEILRESFIRLHTQDLMQKLRDEQVARFENHRNLKTFRIPEGQGPKWRQVADRIGYKFRGTKRAQLWVPFCLPPIPQKGDFDIKEINKSKYFFH